ncbi:MAG: 3-oxoacyl-[acyl-carrier-protein] synthase III C-terminal domain-containing protein, partial [Candidatus Subteraquimicrobiales bacterium]|nr:3-oxoacyl-[acyl-carrier-protein] synthase III C-terminal domain-containing protein [Candidatus Subteraquimicrobiales bacterium]
VDFLIPHQANQRIITSAAKKLKIDPAKVISNIESYGNTSSASIPIALYEIYREGKLKKGDIILSVGFGGGLTWGASVIRWYKEP